MRQYLYILMFTVILMLICTCKKRKEYFNSDLKFKNQIMKKEAFEPNCSSIYGKYNPRCRSNSGSTEIPVIPVIPVISDQYLSKKDDQYLSNKNLHSNLYHVGYYTHMDQKYPILDIKNKNKVKKGLGRYILNGKNIKPFSQKHWDKIFYFKKPFPYENNIPYSFIFNFLFSGKITNNYIKKTYYIFEKKMGSNLYKYVLFEYLNGTLKFSFSLPDRNKINLGDIVFIRDRSSTLGPFTFVG